MKRLLLLLALVASVYADGAHLHHAATDGGASSSSTTSPPAVPLTSQYAEPPDAPRPSDVPSPASSFGAPQPTAAVDQQGYYYYYYPVQEEKTKGIFDFKKDTDILFVVIIGVVIVGALLLAISFFDATRARTFDPIHISYEDMYDVAKKVYQAISKKY